MNNCNNFPVSLYLRRMTANREYGFAYIWTLLLIAFMGIGLALAAEVYSTSVQRENEKQLIAIGREFRLAIARYYEANHLGAQRQYPTSLEELLKDPRFPNVRRHLRKIYTDPMTGKKDWGLIYVNGKIVGIHSLSEKKPIKQDNFEVGEGSFRGKEKYADWTFTYPSDLLVTAGSVNTEMKSTNGFPQPSSDVKTENVDSTLKSNNSFNYN